MANEGFAPAIASTRPSLDQRIAEAGFVILLLLVLVGLTPFNDMTPGAQNARNATTAGGDGIRQIAFLGTFALVIFAAARKRGLMMLKAIPISIVILLGWCLLSALWGDEPDVIARRAILAMIFASSLLISVDTLGTERTVAIWRYVIGAIIVLDIVTSLTIRNAVHLPSDVEADLAGAWRGLHSHKNAAGSIAAAAAAMFFYFALETRRRTDVLLCALSVFFLVMTRSKASLGLLPIALIAGGLYRVAWRSRLDRAIAACAAALFFLTITVAIAWQWEAISRFLDDPQHFTGRSAIWQAELAYIKDHLFLGAGFGTFGNTGARSPIFDYVGRGWISQIGEGHNGYLEMLVTIGLVGFLLSMIAVVAIPFLQFWSSKRTDANFNALLFTLFTFALLHNFMESDFINVTAAQWGQFLLLIAFLRVSSREADERERAQWTA